MLLVFALTDVTTPLPPGLTHFDQITQSHDLLQHPPAVEPGLPVWEGGFSLLLPETACANHLFMVQTHPSVEPCCLDPPQRLSMYSPSTNFQVLTPLTFQGADPCSPPRQAQHQEMGSVLLHPAWAAGSSQVQKHQQPVFSRPPAPGFPLPALGRNIIPSTGGRAPSKKPTGSNALATGAQTTARVHPGRESALPFPLHEWQSQHELIPGTPVWVTWTQQTLASPWCLCPCWH